MQHIAHQAGAGGARRPARRTLALVAVTVAGLVGFGLVAATSADASSASCGAKPDASNTGAGGKLAGSKDRSLTKNKSRLENTKVVGSLTVSGSGTVVRNVKVTEEIVVLGDHITLDHVTAKNVVIAGAQQITVSHANLSGGGTAVHVTSDRGADRQVRDVTLTANYIHDPASTERTSYSGTHVRGANGMTITCSTYALGAYGNGAIYLEDANGGTSNVTIAKNWLDGGGFTVYSDAQHVLVEQNAFGTAARYGICRDSTGGLTQNSNRYISGATANPCHASTRPGDGVTIPPAPKPTVTTSPPKPSPTTTSPTVRPTATAAPTTAPSSTKPAPAPTVVPPSVSQPPVTTPPASPTSCTTKPSASTTGASGSRPHSGTTILTDGQSLHDVDVSSLEIRGSGVTVRNVSVAGNIFVTGDNTLIDHVTTQGVAISSASNVTVKYANIGYSTEDAIHVTSDRGRKIHNVVLSHNYIHDPRVPADAHFDGTQVRGADGMTINCSVYDPGAFQWTFNAGVYLEDANGGNTDIRVTDNWLYGFAFPVMVDGRSSTFTGNRIGGDIKWDTCLLGKNATFTSSGNVWDVSGAKVNLCGMG